MSYERRWSGRLSIRHDAVMDVQVLTLEGELDIGTMAEARGAVRRALEIPAPLVLDLRMLRAIDPTGTSLLMSGARRAGGSGTHAALVPPHDVEVWRTLSEAGVEDVLDVKRSLSEAIQAVGSASVEWTPSASTPIG